MQTSDSQSNEPDRAAQPDEAGGAGAPGTPAAGAGADACAAGPRAEPSLEGELADALAKAAENYDLYVRARAETDNVRRRAQEDVAKAHKYAIEAFAESLLPVRDSLEMALKADAPTVDSLREGVEATLRLMASTFEKNKLMAIDPAGRKFDPNLHQAISMVPVAATNPPVPANHVATVLQKGYLINDRVLRPALVIVAQG